MRVLRTCLFLAIACVAVASVQPARAVSKTVIFRLHAAARAEYANPGDEMPLYNVMVYRDKAYAITRGTAHGVPTIAVWEYVPNDWHRVFDYPISDAHSPEISQKYRAYGFTYRMQMKMLGATHNWP